MSDRIAVFNDGVVQQCATPDELYEQPGNAFVADFIGENNMVPGSITAVDDRTVRVCISGDQHVVTELADAREVGAPCIVSVRPEKIFLEKNGSTHDNNIKARFIVRHYCPVRVIRTIVRVLRFGGTLMRRSVEIKLSGAERSELERLARGRKVWRALSDRAHIVLLAAEGLNNLQIANTLGINNLTARKWRNRFAEHGMDGAPGRAAAGPSPAYR